MDTWGGGGRAAAADLHRRINQGTAVPYPDDRGVKELFEEVVRRVPDAVALVHRERTVRYGELNRAANRLAHRLRAGGVRPGAVVGVCADRSPALVAALLAVVKCGAAYLPLDAAWPEARLWQLLAAAGCQVLVTDLPDTMGARLPGVRVVPVGGEGGPDRDPGPDADTDPPEADPETEAEADPDVVVGPDDIAYINFTSGSTGVPKGVPVRHRSIARLVFGARYARLDGEATLLQLAPVTFDAATFEIWGALLHGGRCVLHPSRFVQLSELGEVLRDHRVTVVFLTTALFNTVLDEAPGILDGVPSILTGGEAHSLPHMAQALSRYGPGRVVHMYGPTECTTFATYHPLREIPADGAPVPIGLPVQNTEAYVVREDGRLCGPGEVGELLIGGPGLSPGYLSPAGATRERFTHLEAGGRVRRLYRTGDLVHAREDGALVFRGRADGQVKVDGHRIEPAEVAHHLNGHPLVRQSHVAAAPTATGGRRLVAFVVPADAGTCTAALLRAYLQARLPAYLVPADIRFLDALPLSPHGKVDTRALLGAGRGRRG
ncbi:amino acid adenylation domain-containing protein [Streptomyces sp. enrichment culture]|uniref:amino acid adenylation domain-containing protein n=1 Tax=Streptomyces sp. enrichment culture TaxID=1795815 RepID=UPI003F5604C2